MLNFDEKDEIFIGDKVLKLFGNCLDCGICCKIFSNIEIQKEEIKKITRNLKIKENSFLKKYTDTNNNFSSKIFLKNPCKFQKINKCSIHKIKPFDCKTFPLCINLTKKQAILTGIYLCPQATHFYQGFLDYCQKYFPNIYKKIVYLEKNTNWTKLGLELTLSSKSIFLYIDSLYSEKKQENNFIKKKRIRYH